MGGIESTYISKSYNNRKDAAVKFISAYASKTVTLPSTHKDIGESLSQHAQKKLERRKCFKTCTHYIIMHINIRSKIRNRYICE